MLICRSNLYFKLNIAILLNPWIIRTRTITQANFKRSIFVTSVINKGNKFVTSVINIIVVFIAKIKTKYNYIIDIRIIKHVVARILIQM